MKAPVRVTVTGPAGQIGYATLFRIASGAMFGPDQLTLVKSQSARTSPCSSRCSNAPIRPPPPPSRA